jgi:hypothetical protein
MPHTPEQKKAYDKAYRAANKEKRAAQDRAWYETHKEHRADYITAYYAANKDSVDATCKAWAQANHEKVLGYKQVWNDANKEWKRAWALANHPEWFRKAYDPNCRPFPATLDLVSGLWFRCERTFLPAPDKSLAAHLAAAIIVIDERLAEGAA